MNNIDDAKNLAKVMRDIRNATNITQDEMAMALGVSKNTICNFEKGTSHPTLHQFKIWCDTAEVNPMPYLCKLFNPEIIDTIKSDEEEPTKFRKTLTQLLDTLTDEEIKFLIFQIMGSHGSDPHQVLHLFDAYLHLPMFYKSIIARVISDAYEMCDSRRELLGIDFTTPDINGLQSAIEAGKSAAKNNKNRYKL